MDMLKWKNTEFRYFGKIFSVIIELWNKPCCATRSTYCSIMHLILNEAKICSLEEKAEEEILFESDENAEIVQ